MYTVILLSTSVREAVTTYYFVDHIFLLLSPGIWLHDTALSTAIHFKAFLSVQPCLTIALREATDVMKFFLL